MPIRGLIELTPELDREQFRRLVWTAERLAANGKVILVLNTVSPRAVSRHLRSSGQFPEHGEWGLRYQPIGTVDDALLDQVRRSEFAIADSDRLSAALLSKGILHMRAREGVGYLRTLLPERDRKPSHPENTGLLTSW